MRDALTLLEQHTLGGKISLEYVRSSLSLIEDSLIEEVIRSIQDKNITRIFEIISILKERHIQVRGFFDQILYSLRDKMISGINSPEFSTYSEIMEVFMSAYSKIKVIPDEILLIEITLMRAVKR
jgi:DNA polymerase III gamma/tau subunit